MLSCLTLLTALGAAPVGASVVVVDAARPPQGDRRLRRLVAALARAGLEAGLAGDVDRPCGDPSVRAKGEAALQTGRSALAKRELRGAADALDFALEALERCASGPGDLRSLVNALVARAIAAVDLGEPATAETCFARALALDPALLLDAGDAPDEARRVFGEVRRATRLLPLGEIEIEAPGIDGVQVQVDFRGPAPPPYSSRPADGRHFVTVVAPGRRPLVDVVTVRAERTVTWTARPLPSGDPAREAAAYARFDPADPKAVARLAEAFRSAGVVVAETARDRIQLTVCDPTTGLPRPDRIVLGGAPSREALEQAAARIIAALPEVAEATGDDDDRPWYATWWAITLFSVAAAGAVTATAVILTREDEVTYRFEP